LSGDAAHFSNGRIKLDVDRDSIPLYQLFNWHRSEIDKTGYLLLQNRLERPDFSGVLD